MSIFKFKQFEVNQANSAMKIGTDAMIFGALIDVANKKRGLDIGSGTGVLSLMVAQKNKSIQIQAIEIESFAYQESKENFEKSIFKHQLEAIHSDIKSFKSLEKFDLIFTNPPYFENSSKSISDERNLARHTDMLTLSELASKLSQLITNDGDVWVILPLEQMQSFSNKMLEMQFFIHQQILIFGKENQAVRQIFCFSKGIKKVVKRELILRNENNQYTEAYKELTKEYHFNKL